MSIASEYGFALVQAVMFGLILLGLYLINHYNDYRTHKNKRKHTIVGITLIALGSLVILAMWFRYLLTYKPDATSATSANSTST